MLCPSAVILARCSEFSTGSESAPFYKSAMSWRNASMEAIGVLEDEFAENHCCFRFPMHSYPFLLCFQGCSGPYTLVDLGLVWSLGEAIVCRLWVR